MVESINIIVSYLFLIIVILFWWLIFISLERKDKRIQIIEKPIYGRKLQKESQHRRKKILHRFFVQKIFAMNIKTTLSYFKQCEKMRRCKYVFGI